jgi:hypothetical protein
VSRYLAWAPGADRFAPVLIDSDYDVQVPDPGRPGSGLTGRNGQPVRFRDRIQLLAVDSYDAYWLVRHTVSVLGPSGPGGSPDAAELTQDEAALADAWAWEQFYPGLVIAGTIHNELLLPAAGAAGAWSPAAGNTTEPGPVAPAAPRAPAARRPRWLRSRPDPAARPPDPGSAAGTTGPPLVRQHEPSGGGRSIPQHRRMDARAREPVRAPAIEQISTVVRVGGDGQAGTGAFRRTWVRHSPAAVTAAGRRVAADAAAMLAAGPSAAPNPGDANCRPCAFLEPCLAMRAGRDSEFLLRSGFRTRPPDVLTEGRLGGGAWGTGRGAAPFRGRA